jgi:hypothetical protein
LVQLGGDSRYKSSALAFEEDSEESGEPNPHPSRYLTPTCLIDQQEIRFDLGCNNDGFALTQIQRSRQRSD